MERESGRKQRQGNNGTDGAGTYEPRGGLSFALSEVGSWSVLGRGGT